MLRISADGIENDGPESTARDQAEASSHGAHSDPGALGDRNYEEIHGVHAHRRKRRVWLVIPALALAAALGGLVFGALGVIGDTDFVTAPDAVDSGTVALSTSASSETLSNAALGDNYFMFVSVQNAGTLHGRVSVTTAARPQTPGDPEDETLGQYIDVDAQWNGFNQATCAGTANPAGPTVRLNAGTIIPVLGSLQTGQQTGDEAVDAAATENLCVRYNLPLTAENAAQDGVVSLDLNFAIEQTKNS